MTDDLKIVFQTTRGEIMMRIPVYDFTREPGFFLKSMELQVNDAPIVRVPFNIHDGVGLHTMCRRFGPNIDVLEF